MSDHSQRHWSGPPNPPDRPGQRPGVPAPAVEALPVNDNSAQLKAARLADLAEIAERIKFRIKRTTADVVATGKDLLLAQQRLGSSDVLAWVESELGMTRRWAQLQIAVAKTFGEVGEIVSSVSPTTIYKLAAPSTPAEIKAEVVADLKASRPIDYRAILLRLKAGESKPSNPVDQQIAALMRAWDRAVPEARHEFQKRIGPSTIEAT
jgi:hypothetical protein